MKLQTFNKLDTLAFLFFFLTLKCCGLKKKKKRIQLVLNFIQFIFFLKLDRVYWKNKIRACISKDSLYPMNSCISYRARALHKSPGPRLLVWFALVGKGVFLSRDPIARVNGSTLGNNKKTEKITNRFFQVNFYSSWMSIDSSRELPVLNSLVVGLFEIFSDSFEFLICAMSFSFFLSKRTLCINL